MSYRLCAVLVAGVLAAACSHTETRTVVVPAPVDDSCTYYGYVPGTEAYRICAEREAAARRRGRMQASYAEAAIVADSQEACSSYPEAARRHGVPAGRPVLVKGDLQARDAGHAGDLTLQLGRRMAVGPAMRHEQHDAVAGAAL